MEQLGIGLMPLGQSIAEINKLANKLEQTHQYLQSK